MLRKAKTMLEVSKIVPIEDIPKNATDVPLDNLADVYRICLQMERLCDLHNGIGLAAVQVGIPWKLFMVKSDGTNPFTKKGEYGYFLNCDYEPITDFEQVVSLEGCLSVRSEEGQLRHFQVQRYDKIILKGCRLYFDNCDKALKIETFDREIGFAEQGIVFQHEIDHARQILISDIGNEVFLW